MKLMERWQFCDIDGSRESSITSELVSSLHLVTFLLNVIESCWMSFSVSYIVVWNIKARLLQRTGELHNSANFNAPGEECPWKSCETYSRLDWLLRHKEVAAQIIAFLAFEIFTAGASSDVVGLTAESSVPAQRNQLSSMKKRFNLFQFQNVRRITANNRWWTKCVMFYWVIRLDMGM